MLALLRPFSRSWFVLAIALTCLSQGYSLREERSLWKDLGNTIKDVGDGIRDNVRSGLNTILEPPWIHRTTTEEPTTLDLSYRNFIGAPVRCPPNHALVKGRCRMNLG